MQLLMPLLLAKNIELANLENLIAGFGDGSDGEILSGATINLPSEDDITAILQVTRLNIPSGQTLTVDKRCRGLIIYSQSDVTINGTIDMNYRGAKVSRISSVQKHLEIPIGNVVYSIPGGGGGGDGGKGGKGGNTYGGSPETPESPGAEGAEGSWFGGGFGGGGGGGNSGSYCDPDDPHKARAGQPGGDSDMDLPVAAGVAHCGGKGANGFSYPNSRASVAGSGGGGGGVILGEGGATGRPGQPGVQGGLGGGLIVIIARGSVTIGAYGKLLANGQDGGDGGDGGGDGAAAGDYARSDGGGGGGGSGGGGGGVIVIASRGSYTNDGALSVNGGAGSTGGARGEAIVTTSGNGKPGTAGTAGTAGSIGTIAVLEV